MAAAALGGARRMGRMMMLGRRTGPALGAGRLGRVVKAAAGVAARLDGPLGGAGASLAGAGGQGRGRAGAAAGGGKAEVVFDVTEATFAAKVMQSKVPVVLDCYADWCGPCKTLGPILEKAVRAQNGKVLMAKLDTDKHPRLAQSLQVKSLPTVMAVYQGRLLDQFIGAQPAAAVAEFVARTVAAAEAGSKDAGTPIEQAETLLQQAQQAIETDSAPAEQIAEVLKRLADLKPVEDEKKDVVKRLTKVRCHAHAGLARLALAQGELDAAKSLLAVISSEFPEFGEDTEVVSLSAAVRMAEKSASVDSEALAGLKARQDALTPEERLTLARDLLATGDYSESADHALALVKEGKFRDEAKGVLFEMFGLLGSHHEVVKSARRRLANLLL